MFSNICPRLFRQNRPESPKTLQESLFCDVKNPINDRCPITWTDFSDDTPVVVIISCGHVYLPEHLARWFQKKETCPMCGSSI